jgi:hypothetical protein
MIIDMWVAFLSFFLLRSSEKKKERRSIPFFFTCALLFSSAMLSARSRLALLARARSSSSLLQEALRGVGSWATVCADGMGARDGPAKAHNLGERRRSKGLMTMTALFFSFVAGGDNNTPGSESNEAGGGDDGGNGNTLNGNDRGLAKRYIPFAEGPRSCVGQSLAKTNLVATLASLLPGYHFALDESMGGAAGVRAREQYTLVTGIDGGMMMRAIPRKVEVISYSSSSSAVAPSTATATA